MSGMSKYRLRPRNMSLSIVTTLFFINTDFELDYNMDDLNEKYHSKKQGRAKEKKSWRAASTFHSKHFTSSMKEAWWIFCWPDRMLHQSLQSCDLTHGRTEVKGVKSIITDGMTHFWQLSPWDGSLYQRVLKSRKKSTITLEAAQPHDIIMVSEPRLQGREVKEGNIGRDFFVPLDSLFSSIFFSNFREWNNEV